MKANDRRSVSRVLLGGGGSGPRHETRGGPGPVRHHAAMRPMRAARHYFGRLTEIRNVSWTVARNVSADARRGLPCAGGHGVLGSADDHWRIEHAVSPPFMARTPVSRGPLSILAKITTLRNQKRPTSFSKA